ncbi:hypothetical protein JYJ95_17780 [Corallococcus exiguus]|uniref:hypothetical protein n=1 Tax=Corallococcus exiguus TaxID=83462 RepID=UPI001A909D8C|nr:hypothetical protein [Corallococcus exiguus]MBN8468371.1 hypothetical protein [Corallococcus exiguus]
MSSAVFGQKAFLGQANGPDVELIVSGTEHYATYETVEGFTAIYDDALGRFYYARVIEGRYESTGVPVTSPPPPGLPQHARESDEVRSEKIRQHQERMKQRSHPTPEQE